MPKKTLPVDILKQFAILEKKASKQVYVAKAAIEKKIAVETAAIQKKYAKELKQLEGMLSRFGISAVAAPVKVKAAPTGKRTRRTLPKITDVEIKAKLITILAEGKKVSSAVIFKEINIARPRFAAFLKANTGFVAIEGNKRSTLYSLQG